jgi:hypothetical protein
MSLKAISRAVVASMGLIVVAAAQTPFQLLVTVGNNASLIQDGSTLTFSSSIGQAQTARVTATYTGTGQVTVSQPPAVIGSSAFTAKLTATPPLMLNPGNSFAFDIQFIPTDAAQNIAQLSQNFTETTASASVARTINLSLTGTASSIVLSYVLQTDQNVVPLQPGQTIIFPPTPIKTTAQAALNLTNRGSGAGTITGISITGSAFRLTLLPLFPFTLPSGQNLQVLVLYQPTAVNSDTGQIMINFDSGSPVTLNLQGSGNSASFVYQIVQANPITVTPGGAISLPDTNVGDTSSVVIRVLNSGNANGTVNSITLAGQGFQLGNNIPLPQTLAPDASLTAMVTFTPTKPGSFTGDLIINSDSFNLVGMGLGPQLTFSYLAGDTTITIGGANPSVVFSPVTISQSSQLEFHVKNTGTLPASIANIGVAQVNGPFSLMRLPALPLSLAPNADLQFTINFTPTALGFSNGMLLIDTTTVPLVGSGATPPPLPSYTIVGPSGNTPPGSQSSVGLNLANTYPVAIAGTLTLGVSGDLPPDPAVQFATGGRAVPFLIPANGTDAVFGGQGTRVGLQTGTVASSISITPSFATLNGNVDLTPNPPTVLQFAVTPAPPTLTVIQLSSPSTNSLLIKVTGFSTTRTLKAWNVQFTPMPGVSMPTSQFALDVQQITGAWFRSAASQTFGGQFTMSVQFNFQGSTATTTTTTSSVLSSIASVSVTVSSELGDSNSLQAKVQ